MRKKVLWFGKLALGLALLGFLLFRVARPGAVVTVLEEVSLPLALFAFSLHAVGFYLSAVRWKILLDTRGGKASLPRLIEHYLVALFFNHFLPTRFGGDVVRVADTQTEAGGGSASLAVVVCERLSGILALLVFAVIASLARLDVVSRFPLLYLALIANALALAGIVLALVLPLPSWLRPRPGRWSWTNRILEKGGRFHQATARLLRERGIWLRVMTWAFLLQGNVIVHYWALGRSLHLGHIGLTDYFFVIPLLLFILSIPISINGLGVRDLTLIQLFAVFGIPAAPAIAFSLLDVLFNLVLGVIGGILYLVRRR